jgi:hypothetical protein
VALGHPPGVAAILCPRLPERLLRAATGLHASTFVAADPRGGPVVGCIQFVRARVDTGTWLFGYWRVAPGRRRAGIGSRLIVEGIRRLPGVRRLYSFVDWGNEPSIRAQIRLGFELSEEVFASAPLGLLAGIGPSAPGPRIRRAGPGDRRRVDDLYRRAMGPVWERLFPPGRAAFSMALGGGLEGPVAPLLRALRDGRAGISLVDSGGGTPAFLVLRGGAAAATLFVDPPACDPALLSRVAARLLAEGIPRDLELGLRGVRRRLLESPGPITARLLMGLPEASRLRGG